MVLDFVEPYAYVVPRRLAWFEEAEHELIPCGDDGLVSGESLVSGDGIIGEGGESIDAEVEEDEMNRGAAVASENHC